MSPDGQVDDCLRISEFAKVQLCLLFKNTRQSLTRVWLKLLLSVK